MKEESYTSLICKRFCNYYKPNRENELCGGYFYIQKYLTSRELNEIVNTFHLSNQTMTIQSLSFICENCDFKEGDCDFFVDKSKTPCGGYLIISRLFNYLNL
ncbi:MAG: hypothetical protein ABDH19_02375 [Thermodesulfovibrio sp.]